MAGLGDALDSHADYEGGIGSGSGLLPMLLLWGMTMKTKHTPGPWQASGCTVYTRDKQPAQLVPHDDKVLRVAAACWDSEEEDEQEPWDLEVACANARLIASAPDLYNALCDLLEWAKGNRGRKDNNPYCVPEVRKALEAVGKVQDLWPDQLFEAETGEAR